MGARRALRNGGLLAAVLLARVYLGVVLGLVTWSLLPLLLQWQPTVAMSGSMAPAIQPGDVLVAQPLTVDSVDEEKLTVGQVPLAKDPSNPGQLITHRVVGYADDGYLTRGDANAQVDSATLLPENIVGIERLRIPYIGLPVHGIRTGDWIPVLVFAALTVGAQLLVSYDLKINGRSRRPSNEDGTDEDPEGPDTDGTAGLDILEPNSTNLTETTALTASAGARTQAVRADEAGRRRRTLAFAPALGVLISGLVITGSTASFTGITINDGNTVRANASFGSSEYVSSLEPNPWAYYRLDDPAASGSAADHSVNNRDGSYTEAVSSVAGALPRKTNRALTLSAYSADLTSRSMSVKGLAQPGPAVYSLETWFKTDSTTGGALLSFGSATTGLSNQYDRHIYMDATGILYFGVYVDRPADQYVTVKSVAAYNDNEWHHVVATMGSGGMVLYVDGEVAGAGAVNSNTLSQDRSGYWRIGGDRLSGWPGSPMSNYFTGSLDEVAIYPGVALSGPQVGNHWAAAQPGSVAGYGPTVLKDRPAYYYRFEEMSGPDAYNSVSDVADAAYPTAGAGLGAAGVLTDRTNRAVSFDEGNEVMASAVLGAHPQTFSTEVWFKTTTATGGWIMGLGETAAGFSNHYDRMVYMRDDGGLVFGVYPNGFKTVSSERGLSYNDGRWHLVTATLSAAGMALYVDGLPVGANSDVASAQPGSGGYWRLGYERLDGWENRPSSDQFEGVLDEFVVYDVALSADEVAGRYEAAYQ